MASTIKGVMDGLEVRLQTIAGLRTSEVIPSQINPPQAIIGVPTIPNYRLTMTGASFDLRFIITVIVSGTLDRIGQRNLADYANPTGAQSIKAAIEGDKTLGGIVSDLVVESFNPLGAVEVGDLKFVGGEWTVRVIGSGV